MKNEKKYCPTPSQAGAAQTTNTNTTKQSFPLNNSLTHHSVSHLHEACNISSLHVVDVTVRFCPIFYALCMNAVHNCVQFLVHFGSTPTEMHSVL